MLFTGRLTCPDTFLRGTFFENPTAAHKTAAERFAESYFTRFRRRNKNPALRNRIGRKRVRSLRVYGAYGRQTDEAVRGCLRPVRRPS